MIWTILAALAVVATKFITSMRLKDLKVKLVAIEPEINELRGKLLGSEDEFEGLKLNEEATTTRLDALKGVVEYLENQVKVAKIEGEGS
ncbi:MAG TPA: hypothetical protein QF604_25565 [Candidatus Latescibacteria bacterium]|nr:hypothetical protein [Candidatus Latescibacterota bacterium]